MSRPRRRLLQQQPRELTLLERDLLMDSRCPVPKQWQSNTPNGGFFSRTWGMLVFNRSCVQVVVHTCSAMCGGEVPVSVWCRVRCVIGA